MNLDILCQSTDGQRLGSELSSNRPSYRYEATEREISRKICDYLDEPELWRTKVESITMYEGGTKPLEMFLKEELMVGVWREMQRYPGLGMSEWASYKKWGKMFGTHAGGVSV